MNSDQVVSWKLVLLGRKIRNKRNQFVRNLALTSVQADALRFFTDHPNSTITDFKVQQQVTHQTARLIVKRLVDRELLALMPNPTDNRSKLVAVTRTGQDKLEQLNQHILQVSATLFTGFSAAEQQQMFTMLDRINDNLERN